MIIVGGYPSKVDQGTMRVDYTEDLRDGFFGYSIANLSWSSPESKYCNYAHLASSSYIQPRFSIMF